jgi:trigger factor
MHITKEETGTLTASIRLQISREDYDEKVNKTLRDYQHKANMPGFRPGKVPFGLISKMYRKGILLDEINHIISDNLQKYIEESNLNLIGSPLPNKEKATHIDLDTQSEFEFFFDIGLAPEFELDLSDSFSVDTYKISANDKMIDENIEEIRSRLKNNSHDHEHDHEHEHGEEEPAHDEELPEVNEELFEKVFPGQEIKDLESFRAKIKETIEQSLDKESERFFFNSVIEKLVKESRFDLPEEFIKKMMLENEEKPMSEEEVEKQFDNLVKSLRWQLIEAKIVRENNLFVSEAEIRNVVKGYFSGYMASQQGEQEYDERLEKIVDSVLSNREETNRLHTQIADQKLLSFFREKVKQNHVEIDYDEFVKMVTQKNA